MAVGVAVLARARGTSYDAVADVVGVKRTTLIKAVGRAIDAAPQAVRDSAESVLPERDSGRRGRRDAGIARLSEAVLNAYEP